jgi:SAM-dependent methyltransferase
MADVRAIALCRLCGGDVLRPIVDFGEVALGNNLQETRAGALEAARYPLVLMRCGSCGHFQLGHAVDPRLLYATNYTYLTGVGASFVKHLDDYAGWAVSKGLLPKDALVVDIGSNDGTCLKMFQKRGHRVQGVDPASKPAEIANADGVPTLNMFFGADAVAKIGAGTVDYVTSHNVLAHVDDLTLTFASIYDLLKPGGVFCFEIGYFQEVLTNNLFDTIYHEHLDYHQAEPLARHLTKLGFDMLGFEVNASQGGSLRTLCRKTGQGNIAPEAEAFLARERDAQVNNKAFLEDWRRQIEDKMARVKAMIGERAGKRIAGYGAPTKATLLTKVAGIGPGDVAYVVEDNALKAGRFLPTSGIAISPSTRLGEEPPDALVIFAWNFADDIAAKLRGKFAKPVDLIIPLPTPRIVTL